METRDLAPWSWFKSTPHLFSKEEGFTGESLGFSRDFSNFETLLPRLFREAINSNLKILPRTDLSETDKEYIIEADLPGIQEKDLDVSISKDGILSIQGKRESKEEVKKRNYYRLERSCGCFERNISLPADCDVDKVNTSFKAGTLTIMIPKKALAASQTKKLKINNK